MALSKESQGKVLFLVIANQKGRRKLEMFGELQLDIRIQFGFADKEQNLKMMIGLESVIHKLVLEFLPKHFFLALSPSFLSKIITDQFVCKINLHSLKLA